MILSTPKFLRHEIDCHSCREGWTAEQAGAQFRANCSASAPRIPSGPRSGPYARIIHEWGRRDAIALGGPVHIRPALSIARRRGAILCEFWSRSTSRRRASMCASSSPITAAAPAISSLVRPRIGSKSSSSTSTPIASAIEDGFHTVVLERANS